MNDKYYITTPIYYVNDKPHIGHAYTTILADVLSNYNKIIGNQTYFLTGTDEHGQKVESAAKEKNISPIEQCNQTVVRFQDLWNKLGITNDDFIRTTEERHIKVVKLILQELFDKNEIYKGEYKGWYCESSEQFLTEKDLNDENSPDYGRPVESIVESNYFFKMSKYQDWLIDYIEKNPNFIQPDFRANETLGFLKSKKLQDLCISRPKRRLKWGIELPFDNEFVTYVWFDALINYISSIGYKSDENLFNSLWPCSCHLIGKDILTTHTVYWPIMLKAMGLELPKTIFAHGWWLTGKTKMSKSLGNVVNPMDLIEKYDVDSFRFFLLSEMTMGQDASFTEDAFIKRYNADLANDFGNLVNRVLNMINRYCEGKVPKYHYFDNDEEILWNGMQKSISFMKESILNMKINSGIEKIMDSTRSINKYLETKAPWTAYKNEKIKDVETTLYVSAECLRLVSEILHPLMPNKMSIVKKSLGITNNVVSLKEIGKFGQILVNSKINQPNVLFPRIEI
tara:strand:+ start:332 stop:1864 length:1533 start_codon:yes stop_codon:yes gene_type:complete